MSHFFNIEAFEANFDVLMFVVFQKYFTSVSPVFYQCLTSVSPVFHQCFTSVSPVFSPVFSTVFNHCFISVSKVFQKCFENDSKVFVSLSVLKLFVRIEVIAATRALRACCRRFNIAGKITNFIDIFCTQTSFKCENFVVIIIKVPKSGPNKHYLLLCPEPSN